MSLCDLTTPFKRRRIIGYGTDGCKVVRHWHEVQHVVGSLYKSRETKDEHNMTVFDLYILFDGVKDGILYGHFMKHPEWYTPEKLQEDLVRGGYDTPENFTATLDATMERRQFIGNAMIEFVRQFNPDKADEYAAYRATLLAQREAAERAEAVRRQAEEDADRQQREAAMQAERAKYMGWADDMTNMRFGRVSTIMDKPIRVNGRVVSKRDFIIGLVNEGWTPEECKDVISYYGSRWEPKKSKPKTEYQMCRDNRYYTVTKTEYEFAVFLTTKKNQEAA